MEFPLVPFALSLLLRWNKRIHSMVIFYWACVTANFLWLTPNCIGILTVLLLLFKIIQRLVLTRCQIHWLVPCSSHIYIAFNRISSFLKFVRFYKLKKSALLCLNFLLKQAFPFNGKKYYRQRTLFWALLSSGVGLIKPNLNVVLKKNCETYLRAWGLRFMIVLFCC